MPDLICPDCKQPFKVDYYTKEPLEAVEPTVVYVGKAVCACKDALYMDCEDTPDGKASMEQLQAGMLDKLASLKPGDRERDRAIQEAAYEAARKAVAEIASEDA